MNVGINLKLTGLNRIKPEVVDTAFHPSQWDGHVATTEPSSFFITSGKVVQWLCRIGTWVNGVGDYGTPFAQPSDASKRGVTFNAGGKNALRIADTSGYNGPELGSGDQTIAICTNVRSSTGRILNADNSNSLIQPRRTGLSFFTSGIVCSNIVDTDETVVMIATKESSGNWRVYKNGVNVEVNPVSERWDERVCIGLSGAIAESCDCDIWGISVLNKYVSGDEVVQLNDYMRALAP